MCLLAQQLAKEPPASDKGVSNIVVNVSLQKLKKHFPHAKAVAFIQRHRQVGDVAPAIKGTLAAADTAQTQRPRVPKEQIGPGADVPQQYPCPDSSELILDKSINLS